MTTLLRSILAVIVGFVAASVVMMMVETLNGTVIYPELGESARGVTDREIIREILANAPVGAFLVVAGGWILGGIAGGFVATKIAGSSSLFASVVLGCLLTLAAVANNLMLPPPLWFWFVGTPVLLPSAYLGGRLAIRRAKTLGDQP